MNCSEVSPFCWHNGGTALHLANDLSSLEPSDLPRILLSVKFINVQCASSSSSLITMSNRNSLNSPVRGEFFF